jgi:SNF2 family DNA or RNA helicase
MGNRIVTYKELMSQYPDKIVLKKLYEKYTTDDISFQRELDKIVGILFQVKWYRIILDEAHAIKNAESRSTLQFTLIRLKVTEDTDYFLLLPATTACCALLGKYRWALSGTPLANSSDGMCSSNLNHCPEMVFVNDCRNVSLHEIYPM